jgi:hypothetical protein
VIVNASVVEAYVQCDDKSGGAQTGPRNHHLQWWNVTGPASNVPDGTSSLEFGIVSGGPNVSTTTNTSTRAATAAAAAAVAVATHAVFTNFAVSTLAPTSYGVPETLYPVPYFFPPTGPVDSILGDQHAANFAIGILDVTLPPFSADPLGVRDATEAVQWAVDFAYRNYLVAYVQPSLVIPVRALFCASNSALDLQ